MAGAYLGLRGLTSAFKGIVQTNKEFESLSGSLKTVTGSAKGAQEAFSIIEKFALDTPYQLEEIIEAFTRLKALGLDATSEALTSYGNTASAFGKNILDFTSAVSSAVMLNFKLLRTFGIQTQVEGDKVRFTFQGITTTVGKSAQEIEAYLKSIGLVNFGGAMKEQMDTMGGAMSIIEDAISKLIRSIGENGLNKALKDTFSQFNELLDSSDGTAKAIGQTLATAVNVASKAFFTLVKYIEPIINAITNLRIKPLYHSPRAHHAEREKYQIPPLRNHALPVLCFFRLLLQGRKSSKKQRESVRPFPFAISRG